MDNQMFALADKITELKSKKDDLAEITKLNNAEIENTEKELVDFMIGSETQSFNRAGTLIFLTSKLYASAVAEQKQELYETLKSNGFGSLVTETVNANSLAAFVKEQIAENEDELPVWLDGKVNVFEKTTIGIRKSK